MTDTTKAISRTLLNFKPDFRWVHGIFIVQDADDPRITLPFIGWATIATTAPSPEGDARRTTIEPVFWYRSAATPLGDLVDIVRIDHGIDFDFRGLETAHGSNINAARTTDPFAGAAGIGDTSNQSGRDRKVTP
ncbi:hypothetical protein QQG74_09200 [Micromonospora sp. FIMYZ51]|uniref:hypothetical protein n=1 Tax=Micromonospora sp. FIMYZ51 TaxID=3051832 RepID=UPI00311F00CB